MGSLNKTKNFYSPLRYPGGKGCIFKFVSKFFYENNLIGTTYAEPYAGGAGLALRLLFEGYAEKIYLNDIDPSIYAFWKTIVNNPDDFCKWIKEVKINLKKWTYYKYVQNNTTKFDDLELSKSTFFLNRTNISGVIKGGLIGGKNQQGKYKMDARFNKSDLINRIQRIATQSARIKLSNMDGIKFLRNLDKQKENIFIYLDPPYFCKGAELYMSFYTEKDHIKLSNYVKTINKRWMVSYDKHDFILKLYEDQKKITYLLPQCASNRIGNEILIFSENLNFFKSISHLKSPLFLT